MSNAHNCVTWISNVFTSKNALWISFFIIRYHLFFRENNFHYGPEPAYSYYSPSQHYCRWLVWFWARSGPITYFTKPALLCLAGTVMGEVGTHNIFHRASISVDDWHTHGRRRGDNTFHAASICVIFWHINARGRGPNIFHGASTTVVRWQGYGWGWGDDMLNGVSITVVGWHGYWWGCVNNIFHGASFPVIGWHGFGRDRGP